MEIVKVRDIEGKERYYVADNRGIPIEPVLKFIKFKDNIGYAKNTLKQYASSLKLYYEYLEEINKIDTDITIDDLSLFVNWLQVKKINKKIVNYEKQTRSNKTINITVSNVLVYYDYLLRQDKYSNNISERLKKFLSTPNRNFKGFLYGIAYENKKITSNILKLKEPVKEVKTLKKEEVIELIDNTTNFRDRFLLTLLYETGVRIGEALSLWLEDIDISNNVLEIKDRGNLENNAEIKTVTSPRKVDISQNIVDMYMEYINKYHDEKVETNHIFIKIAGNKKSFAMDYVDVDNLIRNLRNKTNIYVTPHMFRHTSITILRMAGWKPECLRVRVGHKNIYTTLNIYVHPNNEEITEEFNKTKETVSLEGGCNNE